MAEVIEINDPTQFDEKFEALSKSEEYFICIFTGGVDPATGQNWCPDCEVAKPNIQNILIANTQLKVLIAYVPTRGE
jgi:hypothetical protein